MQRSIRAFDRSRVPSSQPPTLPLSHSPINKVSVPVIVLVLLCGGACSSGPGPVNGQPYEQQVVAWRAAKDASFRAAGNDGSPIPVELRATFPGLVYYPIDPAYHVPARLIEDRSGPPQIIELQTSKDQHEPYRKVGVLSFSIGDAPVRLTAFANGTMESLNRLFVPFGDLTNGGETYRGGRFLELDRTPTGLYDLDFNRAYHPYCVYNHDWECPVPPRENRLAVAIRAGERLGDAKSDAKSGVGNPEPGR